MLFALAGSIAQLIDGSLGMGFGLTSSTLQLHQLRYTQPRLEQLWHQVHLIGIEIILIAQF
jgi:uncharacterized membrane protein YfcA